MRLLAGIIVTLLVIFSAAFVVADARGLMSESSVAGWLRSIEAGSHAVWILVAAIAALLAVDLFLPVPSSVVMVLSGYFLGTVTGALVSFVGAVASALCGFWLCRRLGRRGFRAAVGNAETERVEALFARYGDWAIVLSRPVPMLTEIVSCVSGLSGMSGRRFALLSSVATLPLCALYAWAGHVAGAGTVPWWMLTLVFVLPAAGLAMHRAWATRLARAEKALAAEPPSV